MPLAFSIIVTIFVMGWIEDKSIDKHLVVCHSVGLHSVLDDY